MIIGIKDSLKLTGIMIVSGCAVFVCTLFLNYSLDLAAVEEMVSEGPVRIFYEAQKMTCKVVCGVTGGCLLATSVVLLCFYSKHYIDTHRKELGILKALGYSNLKIARGFWSFGLSVLLGTAAGFLGGTCMMPVFYGEQLKENLLPEITVRFHPSLLFFLVLLPGMAFAALAVLYAWAKLRTPVQALLRGKPEEGKRYKDSKTDLPFLQELRKGTVRQRKTLVFFIGFAAFCYSAMLQMSASMDELASAMMGYMMLFIGVILACVTLILAVTTVINANTKTIAMLRAFGYSRKECGKAILSGYRPFAWLGFAIGTGYQYGLLKAMVTLVFRDVEGVPDFYFDKQSFAVALVSFAFLYELAMYCYARRILRISVKQIMLE